MSMKLIILGLLMEDDSHPYELRQKMKERNMHHYIKMQDGSLYYAMEQLKKEQLVDVVQTLREGNRPDKTVFSITQTGKEYFQELLLSELQGVESECRPFYTALIFARHGDQEKIAAIIEERMVRAQKLAEERKALYEQHIPIVPNSVLHMMWGSYEHAVTEWRWLKRLHRDAKDGRLHERGKPLELND